MRNSARERIFEKVLPTTREISRPEAGKRAHYALGLNRMSYDVRSSSQPQERRGDRDDQREQEPFAKSCRVAHAEPAPSLADADPA